MLQASIHAQWPLPGLQCHCRPTRTRSVESELVQLRADNERLVLQLVEKQVEIARLSEEEVRHGVEAGVRQHGKYEDKEGS